MAKYNATIQGGNGTLAIFFTDGESKTLQSTAPGYAEALTYLVSTPEDQHDEGHLKEVVNPALRIGRRLKAVDEKFDFDLYTLSYDGFPLSGDLADLIKERLHNQHADLDRFIRFASRLEQNPSYGAKQGLYSWVTQNGLTILEDGRFVAHKAVDPDGLSQHAGPNNFIDGVLYGKPGVAYRVPHAVGTVVSKRRADVDDSTVACATGLHIGTLRYATDFAPVLLTVAVAPEDVVGGNQHVKIRVAAYEVLGLNESKAEFVNGDFEIVDRSGEVTQAEIDFAAGAPVRDRNPEFGSDEERAEYNSLATSGRNLYANLRTMLAKTHQVAYETALAEHGTWQEFLARQEAEAVAALQAEQAESDRLAEESLTEVPFATAEAFAQQERCTALVEPEHGTGLFGKKVLHDWANANPGLKADLENREGGKFVLGNTEVARKYKGVTTESSVRRYRSRI